MFNIIYTFQFTTVCKASDKPSNIAINLEKLSNVVGAWVEVKAGVVEVEVEVELEVEGVVEVEVELEVEGVVEVEVEVEGGSRSGSGS